MQNELSPLQVAKKKPTKAKFSCLLAVVHVVVLLSPNIIPSSPKISPGTRA